jgi:polyphosphate kinase
MRATFLRHIRREIAHAEAGVEARIVAKMNALDDPELIQEIYRASQAGVTVDLIVRGHCSLRPGLPGYSDRVRVVSIIGRFLEHDRIFFFQNGGDTKLFIGSADWRGRNLDERVEAITPILHPELKTRLIELIELALQDNVLAWEMSSEGSYSRHTPRDGEEPHDLHLTLMEATRRAATDSVEATRPHPPGMYTLQALRYSQQ